MVDKYKLSDVVSIENNCDIDMLHICKRKNNKKRDYLFVNESQGKHVPVEPSTVYKMVKELYNKSYSYLCNRENILVIGFAETATALGELFFEFASTEDNSLDVVRYIHTTRETVDCKELFDFKEEHSHATEQRLYCDDMNFDYDCVVFVEDEITTGNTILNFISKFEQIHHIDNYYVVSVANWQTDEWKEKFREHNVIPISLISGKLKSNDIKLSLSETELSNYNFEKQVHDIKISDYHTARTGESVSCLADNKLECHKVADFIKLYLNDSDIIELVGTEEFMKFPLQVGMELEKDYKVYFHATTRSPIYLSEESIIKDGVSLRSSYDKDRTVYLYNLNRNYDKVFILSEGKATKEFIDDIIKVYISKGIKLSNIYILNLIY